MLTDRRYNNKQRNNYIGWLREVNKVVTYTVVLKVDTGVLRTLDPGPEHRIQGWVVSVPPRPIRPSERVEVVLVSQS